MKHPTLSIVVICVVFGCAIPKARSEQSVASPSERIFTPREAQRYQQLRAQGVGQVRPNYFRLRFGWLHGNFVAYFEGTRGETPSVEPIDEMTQHPLLENAYKRSF